MTTRPGKGTHGKLLKVWKVATNYAAMCERVDDANRIHGFYEMGSVKSLSFLRKFDHLMLIVFVFLS